MDPLTAMAIITVVTAGTSLYLGNKAAQNAQAEQDRLRKEQENARIASTQREMGMASQRTNTALTGAANRKTSQPPSFSSVMGNLPSVNSKQASGGGTGMGSAGTF